MNKCFFSSLPPSFSHPPCFLLALQTTILALPQNIEDLSLMSWSPC
jgi:hypothetical protein